MTTNATDVAPTILVVFGATGDLMARKLVPSLYHLRGKGQLPEHLRVVGFGRRDWGDAELRGHVRGILAGRAPDADPADVEQFLGLFCYQKGVFDDEAAYGATSRLVNGIQDEWGVCSNKLYYLAVAPEHYGTIFRHLSSSGLTQECSALKGWTRVLVEKPFGYDASTACALDDLLASLFREEQIYRIDHYLAKEMLQGIMNFRFTNNLFEPSWNREAIDRIDITLLESIGADKRGAFYDGVGALRDVGQNHLLQMLALITMEQPGDAGADAIRDGRAALIETLVPMTPAQIAGKTFRAQHEGFRDIVGVSKDSATESYFRLETVMAGNRWAGVPVMMESGKRMGRVCKRIVVTFKHPSPCLCEGAEHPVNRIVFTLEPSDRIEIVFFTKKPGFEKEIEQRRFTFCLYEKSVKAQYVEEYARLLHDAMRGDQTLFVSTREIAAGWRFIGPIVDGWAADLVPLESYAPESSDIVRQAAGTISSELLRGRVGVAGLGKMGSGLARNLMDHGWKVVGWNRTQAVADAVASETQMTAVDSLAGMVRELEPPRVIWLMVPAGAPVDELLFGPDPHGDTVGGLEALLEAGDIVIDGGNSRYQDAAPRAARLAGHGIHYADCGTSGGPAGARNGATLMVGGDPRIFGVLEPMLADVAVPGGYRFFPGHGAGHFVKMVHNGIEYGMMQAIAEGFEVLHASEFALDLEKVANLYQHRSVIESRLVGWLEEAYAKYGTDLENASGVVGHSGEGQWTIEAAGALGVPVPVIEVSLQARINSERFPRYAGKVLTALRDGFGGHGLGPGGGPRR